jgi:excisionase family DNA binding protein
MSDTTAIRLLTLMTLMEVATTLRISPHTVRALVRKGKLRPTRICRRLLFSAVDIERLIAGSVDQAQG